MLATVEILSVLLEVSTKGGGGGGVVTFSAEDYSSKHRDTDPCMLLALHV